MDFDVNQWMPILNKIHASLDKRYLLSDDQRESINKAKDEIFSFIDSWEAQQLRARVGFPYPSPSDIISIQPLFENIVRILLKELQLRKLFCPQMHMHDDTDLQQFIKRSLVFEKQPERVVIKGKKSTETDKENNRQIITATKKIKVSLISLLSKEVLNSSQCSFQNVVTCSLHREDQVSTFYDNMRIEDQRGDKIICDHMSFKEENGVFKASKDDLLIPGDASTKKRSSSQSQNPSIAEQKSCFMFTSVVKFNNKRYQMQALSAPFVVMSKIDFGRAMAEALIFWDCAFAQQNRKPFVVPDTVKTDDFLKALNRFWRSFSKANKTIDCFLSERNILHLKSKLMIFPEFCNNPDQVTKAMFNKLHIYKEQDGHTSFTFWEYFFDTLELTHKFKDEFKNGFIECFISREDAKQLLQPMPIGTFLLRFADSSLPSTLGGLTLVYKQSTGQCGFTTPWGKEIFNKTSLKDLLNHPNCKFLAFIYSSRLETPGNIKSKEDMYPREEEKRTNQRYPEKFAIENTKPDADMMMPSPTLSIDTIDSGMALSIETIDSGMALSTDTIDSGIGDQFLDFLDPTLPLSGEDMLAFIDSTETTS